MNYYIKINKEDVLKTIIIVLCITFQLLFISLINHLFNVEAKRHETRKWEIGSNKSSKPCEVQSLHWSVVNDGLNPIT